MFFVLLISCKKNQNINEPTPKVTFNDAQLKASAKTDSLCKSIFFENLYNYNAYDDDVIIKNIRKAISQYDDVIQKDTAFLKRLYRYAYLLENVNSNANEAIKTVEKAIALEQSYSKKDPSYFIDLHLSLTSYSAFLGYDEEILYDRFEKFRDLILKEKKEAKLDLSKGIKLNISNLRNYGLAITSAQEIGDGQRLNEILTEIQEALTKIMQEHQKIKSEQLTNNSINNELTYSLWLQEFNIQLLCIKTAIAFQGLGMTEKAKYYFNQYYNHPSDDVKTNSSFHNILLLLELRYYNLTQNLHGIKDIINKAKTKYEVEMQIYPNQDKQAKVTSMSKRYYAEILYYAAKLDTTLSKEGIKEKLKESYNLIKTENYNVEVHPLKSLNKLTEIYIKEKNKHEAKTYLTAHNEITKSINYKFLERNNILLNINYSATFENEKKLSTQLDKYLKTFNIKNLKNHILGKESGIVLYQKRDIAVMMELAAILENLAIEKKNPVFRDRSLLYYLLASQTLDKFTSNINYTNVEKEQTLTLKNKILQLANQTKDKALLKVSLESIEKKLALELNTKLRDLQIADNDILISKLSKKRNLQNQIALVLSKINNAGQKGNAGLENQYIVLKEKLSSLDKELSTEFPSYSNKNSLSIDINEIQNNLNKNTTILRYLTDETSFYIVKIDNDAMYLKKIKSKNVIKQITNDFYKNLQNKETLDLNSLKIILNDLDLKNENILVINDPDLKIVPLNLISSYRGKNISYQNSLFKYHTQHAEKSNELLTMTPDYDSASVNPSLLASIERSGTVALPFAREEATFITKLFHGDIYQDERATKQNFIKSAKSYNMHHLAMHAVVDEQDDYNAKLLFYGDKEEDYMSLNDIYNLNINADLVTLSACNTAYGKVDPIEGTMSLSRAFQYAGARATLTSLWRVPDRETSIIMKSFYTHLKNGERKDVALKMAQDDYLKNTVEADLKHPYYWAGFILTGDTSPVTTGTPWWYYALGIGLLLLGFGTYKMFTYRKKRTI